MESVIAWLFLAFLVTELAVESSAQRSQHEASRAAVARGPAAGAVRRQHRPRNPRQISTLLPGPGALRALVRDLRRRADGAGAVSAACCRGWTRSPAAPAPWCPWTRPPASFSVSRWARFFSVLSLPLRVYSTFVLEERFGFNKMDARTFVMDRIKGAALALVLGAPFSLRRAVAHEGHGRPLGGSTCSRSSSRSSAS